MVHTNMTLHLPGHEYLGELGKGGMGAVHLYRQLSLDRFVAVKEIQAKTDELANARFRREARALAALHHPNIVQVYDLIEHQERLYLSMEYCAVGSLADWLRRSPSMTWEQAASLVALLSRAIQECHQRGMIHRDLKPHNILLDGQPGDPIGVLIPKVADFGLVRIDDQPALTGPNTVLGTPRYMAPEQVDRSRGDFTPQTDLYSLGVILYELLTGRTPFEGTQVQVFYQILHQPPTAPSTLRANLPSHLEQICLRCLEKNPANRHLSASALALDLEQAVAEQVVRQATPLSPQQPPSGSSAGISFEVLEFLQRLVGARRIGHQDRVNTLLEHYLEPTLIQLGIEARDYDPLRSTPGDFVPVYSATVDQPVTILPVLYQQGSGRVLPGRVNLPEEKPTWIDNDAQPRSPQ